MSIIRMKKLTLLCIGSERARTLEALRDLGVLHVRPVVAPAGQPLEQARNRASALENLLARLPAAAPEGAVAPEGSPDAVADGLLDLVASQKDRDTRLESLSAEAARLAPYGDFAPADIAALAEKGISIKLYHVAEKTVPPLPEGVQGLRLSESKIGSYWALYAKGDFAWDKAEELKLPARGLADVQAEAAKLRAEREAAEKRIAAGAAARPALEGLLARAKAELTLQEVTAGMGTAEKLAYVQGFLPEDKVESVREASARNGWGLVVEEPTAADDVPVALRQPKWAKPIQAVFDGINILPAYKEADVSVVFMLFFSLFFAMIIGDAGYGAIFLGLTLLFSKKMSANVRNLLLVTSAATIVWGLITGSIFGIPQQWLADHGFAKLWPEYLNPLRARSAQNVMGMCFLIGAVQITIGHLWNVWDLLQQKSTKALEQIGWTCTTWYMFFLADNMVIGGNMANYLGSPACLKPFTGSAIDWVCVAGILMIALFMMKPSEIKDGWFNLALLPLNIINNFTDVVSYVRLYAVGAAGFAVANAFNTMIFGGKVTLLSGLVGALLAFLAHTLNILLCVMGVLVHGIRLNTLEFSNHKGISWSGTPYRPFRRTEPTI